MTLVTPPPLPHNHNPHSGGGSGEGGDPPSSSTVPDAMPVAGPDTDWRAFRARLAAMEAAAAAPPGDGAAPGAAGAAFQEGAWAHSVPVPETGCVLLAHPSMFGVSGRRR